MNVSMALTIPDIQEIDSRVLSKLEEAKGLSISNDSSYKKAGEFLLGIGDLEKTAYGVPVPIYDGEVPVFWACGVTPQAAIASVRLPFIITHSPGHMFVLDRKLGD